MSLNFLKDLEAGDKLVSCFSCKFPRGGQEYSIADLLNGKPTEEGILGVFANAGHGHLF